MVAANESKVLVLEAIASIYQKYLHPQLA